MKNLTILSLLICFLISCKKEEKLVSIKKEEKSDIEKYPQKWQLVKITGQFSQQTGTDMYFQEYYLLNSDGTFTKHRERNGTITEVSGSFLFKNFSDGMFIEFTYPSDNAIIANCDNTFIEYLWFRPQNKLTNVWVACDGPGLEYEKIE